MSFRNVFENSKDGKCPICGSRPEERRDHPRLKGWFCSNKNCKYSFDTHLAFLEQAASERKCFIATATYGSYDCPQVWTLRRYRDNTLAQNVFGRVFIKIYYSIAPIIIKTFGKSGWFLTFSRRKLDKFVYKLEKKGYKNTPYGDSDCEGGNYGN